MAKKDYINNNEIITTAVLKELEASGKLPTERKIAEITSLHINTVHKHLNNLSFNPLESPAKLLTSEVVNNLYSLTKTSPQACKLWFQIMESWSEKSETYSNTTFNAGNEIHFDPKIIALHKDKIDEVLALIANSSY